MTKPDFLQECINDPALVTGPVQIDEFSKAYCLVCANRDCARAGTNNMQFDYRSIHWKEMLFDNVPRADDNDSRYDNIRGKKFLPIQPRIEVPGTPNFVSPNMVSVDPSISRSMAKPDDPEVVIATPVIATPESIQIQSKPQSKPTTELKNTPFQQGTILPGGPKAEPAKEETPLANGSVYTFDE